MKTLSDLTILLLTVFALSGCSSAYIYVQSEARVPVSASGFVHNKEKKPVGPEGYTVVKKLEASATNWRIFWNIVDLSNDEVDPFEVLCSGESACPSASDESGKYAIVNLEPSFSVGLVDHLTLYTGFWLPIIPTSHKVSFKGDLVRLK